MFKYETHLHTYPVSRCGRVGVRENLEAYKVLGYDGVFITNHFLDGNVNINQPMFFEDGERIVNLYQGDNLDMDAPITYEDAIHFYFSDYEEAARIGKELGIKVFCGVELTYKGTDFLIYGLDKAWYLAHPEIMKMERSQELLFMKEQGALVIQAHPFREAGYIDHIRLFPRYVHGVEIINACHIRENEIAKVYAQHYGLLPFAGTDNHFGGSMGNLAGICCEEPIKNESDFVEKIKGENYQLFTIKNG